jgi:hypothetical protein
MHQVYGFYAPMIHIAIKGLIFCVRLLVTPLQYFPLERCPCASNRHLSFFATLYDKYVRRVDKFSLRFCGLMF